MSPLGLTSLMRKNLPIVVTLGGICSCYASLAFNLIAFFLATNCAITGVNFSDPNPVSVSLIFQPKLNAQTQFQHCFSICFSTVSAYVSALFQHMLQHCFSICFSTVSAYVSTQSLFQHMFQHCFSICFSTICLFQHCFSI
jgi:hypothetical protein